MSLACHCGAECCQRGRSLGWLGSLAAIAPDDAATQAIGSDTQVNASSRNAIFASARAGAMLNASGGSAYIPGTADCASATGQGGSNNLQLVKTASGLALTGLQVGLTATGIVAGAALAPFTFGISTVIGLFGSIFGHHAAAVRREQSVLCAAVPAANNYLQIIDQAVKNGHATPQDAIRALDSLYSDFQSQVSSIRKDCNAACVMGMELRAIVIAKQSEYDDLAAAQEANQVVAPARPNVVNAPGSATPSSYASFYSGAAPAADSSGSLPSWLPIAAVLFGGFFLARSL